MFVGMGSVTFIPIFQKVDRCNYNNYRGINSCGYKCYTKHL